MDELEELRGLIEEGRRLTKSVKENHGIRFLDRERYASWRTKSLVLMRRTVGESDTIFYKPFEKINTARKYACEEGLGLLDSLLLSLAAGNHLSAPTEPSHEMLLERIFNRFHRVARRLRSRHANRKTLDLTDEYDVQDLLHALLLLHFDDIRAEEWTPSYAGGASRMDFLLKNEKIVIEVKMTRKDLKDRKIGEQLIVDIEKYQVHPDCERLMCFVYDPVGHIGNPSGLEGDLSREEPLPVSVYIRPID